MHRIVLVGIMTVVISLTFMSCGGGTPAEETVRKASPSPVPRAPVDEESIEGEGSAVDRGAEVYITMQDPGGSGEYLYNPEDLSFSVGDKITLVLESETEFHTFTVDGLGIDLAVAGGAVDEVTYTFDASGTYEYICIPHKELGMVCKITVN